MNESEVQPIEAWPTALQNEFTWTAIDIHRRISLPDHGQQSVEKTSPEMAR